MKRKQIHVSLNVGLSFARIHTQQDTKSGRHCFLLCVFNAFFSFFCCHFLSFLSICLHIMLSVLREFLYLPYYHSSDFFLTSSRFIFNFQVCVSGPYVATGEVSEV